MNRSIRFTLAAVAAAVLFTGCLSRPLYEGVTSKNLFISGDEGYRGYRIPSIVSADGVLLAFAEGRVNGFSDTGNIDLVMKRSLDGGKSWSALSVIWDDEGNTCGNPCPVVFKTETGATRILMTATWNDGRDHESEIKEVKSRSTRKVFTFYSDDLGASWSEPVEITSQVKLEGWSWYATGPGMGIQLKKGRVAGRLVIPSDHFDSNTEEYRSHLIYSDDLGENWNIGAIADAGTNESQVIERTDGSLLLNMRRVSAAFPEPYRLTAVSGDGGETLVPAVSSVQSDEVEESDQVTDDESVDQSDLESAIEEDTGADEEANKNPVASMVVPDEQLLSPVCQAAIIKDEVNGRTYFSNPESKRRERLTVKVSFDEGESWERKMLLWKDAAAYSALAVDPEGTLYCLYEAGRGFPYQNIVFTAIDASVLAPGGEAVVLPVGKRK